ncbi:sensor histidine kinase [Jiella sonneratiae]|uniref:histidine kinase n=1 Tax=Jiella sonneratiae TaxID=2816856 RepID=A0ABS3J6D3_9HYPH|nr:sensor histidine kinase [Jiella sonneratiae]MBO0905229.1 sensor histidine kinase [Jiella sonneratiae]
MRRLSIRTLLIVTAAIVASLIALFAILLLSQLNRSDQAALERRTLREAKAISAAAGLIVADMKSTLDLVASAPDLETGALREFHYRTGRILEGSGKFVIVVDAAGQQLLNTRVEFGQETGKTADMASLEEALQTGKTIVSNVFFGKTSARYVFNVVKPLPKSSASPARGLIITKNADELGIALNSQEMPQGWKVAIVDGAGKLIVGNPRAVLSAGETPDIVPQLGFDGGGGLSRDASGQVLIGYARVPATNWYALKWGPVRSARSSLLENWRVLIAGGATILVLLVALTLYAAKTLRASISRLANMAEQVGDGELVSPARSRIKEIDLVAIALSNASFSRREAERRTSVIMQELAHRTKNLMAVVLSMVRQTARHSDDTATMARTLGDRVAALGASVDLLTRGTADSVSLGELVRRQLETFADTAGSICVEGEDLELSRDVAQDLGMALHELATNATKYGALSMTTGRISISWEIVGTPDQATFLFAWKESGGPPVAAPTRRGFGQIVLKDHIQAITGGDVDVRYASSGFEWTLRAPLKAISPRDDSATAPRMAS